MGGMSGTNIDPSALSDPRMRGGLFRALLGAGGGQEQPWSEKVPGMDRDIDPGFSLRPSRDYRDPDPGMTITPPADYRDPDPGFSRLADRITAGKNNMSDPVASPNRIEDDMTKHPQGQDFVEDAPGMASASRMKLAEAVRGGQNQQPDRLSQMEQEYQQLGQPVQHSLKQKIGMFLGGLSGGRGAVDQMVQREQNPRNSLREKLLTEIEAERRMQEQEQIEGERQVGQQKSEDARLYAQQDREDARLKQQMNMAQPEHIDTDQGPLQYNRQSRQWEPISVGGQRVGPKQIKPDSLELQYDEAVQVGDQPRATRLLDEIKQLGAAKQPPQHEPQQLAIDPQGNVVALRPGARVAPGTVTASQYGPEQTKLNQQAQTAATTVNSFNRYQQSFRTLAPQLTEDDRRALQVLTSHEQVAQGFLAKATSGVLDTMFGEPLTGYSEKAMSGIMTKDQFDKLSPAGKKMLADYFNAVIQNFGNMKQILGSVGRNPMQLQAEINTIPLPYIDGQTAETMFADKLEDVQTRNKGVGMAGGGSQSASKNDLGAAPRGATDGAIVRNKATGQRARVQNGRLVPLAAGQQ